MQFLIPMEYSIQSDLKMYLKIFKHLSKYNILLVALKIKNKIFRFYMEWVSSLEHWRTGHI